MASRQNLIVAGFGCKTGCAAHDIARALQLALAAASCNLDQVAALAAPDWKRTEAGLSEAARALDKPLEFVSEHQLQAQAQFALTESARALARAAVPSVAETAALAGAQLNESAGATGGIGVRLLGARQISGGATCALAVLEGHP